MRVRVYDQERGSCFLSELYAVVDTGIFARCLVVFEGRLRMYHQVLPDGDGSYQTMVSMIEPDYPAGWIHLTSGDGRLDFLKTQPEDRRTAFRGYPWVWEDQDTLLRLLNGAEILLSETGYPPVSSLLPGWNYVTDQAGADAFLEETGGLHDAVLAQAHYVSGSQKCPDGGMRVRDSIRRAALLFHTYATPVELVFEGVKAFNLRPGGNNCVSAIGEASCRVRGAMVFFSCSYWPEEKELSCTDTCIWAYSMRWRILPEEAWPNHSYFREDPP